MVGFLALVMALLGACAASKNGCWKIGNKSIKNMVVRSCTPLPPPDLCAACPLKTSNVDNNGNFKDCQDIFQTQTSSSSQSRSCMNALGSLFANNKNPMMGGGPGNCPNDVYEKAYKQLKAGNGGEKERKMIDNLVYNLCEFCCDIVACGNAGRSYEVAKNQSPGLLDPNRDNGPLHLFWDNCQMFPDMKEKVRGGGWLKVCPHATAWKSKKLNSTTKKHLEDQLKQLAARYGCARKGAWAPCAFMEHRMKRINFGSKNC